MIFFTFSSMDILFLLLFSINSLSASGSAGRRPFQPARNRPPRRKN
jgi:hypothetical protein